MVSRRYSIAIGNVYSRYYTTPVKLHEDLTRDIISLLRRSRINVTSSYAGRMLSKLFLKDDSKSMGDQSENVLKNELANEDITDKEKTFKNVTRMDYTFKGVKTFYVNPSVDTLGYFRELVARCLPKRNPEFMSMRHHVFFFGISQRRETSSMRMSDEEDKEGWLVGWLVGSLVRWLVGC
ncbi:hypothetical protein HZH68_007654 [Vespula germanica]|uniref:Uncharacterized protein n=1 Tax=Vespula germanica TaxID=30212 RepID=A0A834KBJ1_VESGE|nr:hypothetical protein HZH68_007654 [Vespula germanica]